MATTGTGQAAARDPGTGWKMSPSVVIEPGARVPGCRSRRSPAPA
jgi:hypothetical protein